ncbi:MAG TPA: DoxX family protein [Burkholderiales bacterium]
MQTPTLNASQDIYAGMEGVQAEPVADWAALLGRIALALIFLWSGYGKLTDIAGTVGYMNAYHVPMAGVLVWPAALLELAGAAMLLAGWQVRWAALALAAYTLLSAAIFHNFWAVPPDQVLNQTIHFMKNVAILGGLLQVFAFGAGRYAAGRG